MARVAPLNPPYTPDIQAAFDAIMPAGVDPLVLFRTLAVNARVYERFRAGGLLDRGLLTLRQREIVIDRTCALNDCEYEWGVHIAFFAAKVKFTPEQIAATVRGTNAEWKEDERVLLDVCEELDATRSISDDLWARLTLHFSSAQDTRNHRARGVLSNRIALRQCIEVAARAVCGAFSSNANNVTISARSAAIVVISHYRASSSAKVLATAARSHGKWPTKATAMLRSA